MEMKPPIKNFSLRPYPQGTMTQGFGENPALYARFGLDGHNGIDIVAPHGEPMFAIEDSYVIDVQNNPAGYGKYVRLLSRKGDDDGLLNEWTYGHCSTIHIKVGDLVKAGDHIADMGNCFDKETEILTNEGWKKFADLNKKETVATLNPETGGIEYHKPYSYTKKMEKTIWQYKNYHSLDLAVTGNHTMYIEKQDGKMHFVNFEDLPKYSWVKQSGGTWVGTEVDEFVLSGIEFGWNAAKYAFTENISIPMDAWLSFMGWYLTDGHVNNYSTRITQSFNNTDKRTLIESVLDLLPFEVAKSGEDYIIHSKQLAHYLKRTSPNKRIPKWIGELSPRQIRIFLDAFHGGDGWYHKSTKYYITPDKDSADVLQELIMKCGGYAVIKRRDPTKINRTKPAMIGNKEVISRNPYYVITEGQHRMGMLRKNQAVEVEYNDYAYCLTVQNHVIYVRRNGRPMWCGNTGFVVSGPTPYWLFNPYAGTHLHLGLRKAKRDIKGFKYSRNSPAVIILNYGNGYKGSIDPAPILAQLHDDAALIEKQLTLIAAMRKLVLLYQQLIKLKQ